MIARTLYIRLLLIVPNDTYASPWIASDARGKGKDAEFYGLTEWKDWYGLGVERMIRTHIT